MKNVLKKAAIEEKKMSKEKGLIHGITASDDRTWRKRGFSSLYGITTLIGWYTDKIINVLVKCKYCKSCEYWKNKKRTAKYKEWVNSHDAESSGKMEVDTSWRCFPVLRFYIISSTVTTSGMEIVKFLKKLLVFNLMKI